MGSTHREMKVEGQFWPYENMVMCVLLQLDPRPLRTYTVAYFKGRKKYNIRFRIL